MRKARTIDRRKKVIWDTDNHESIISGFGYHGDMASMIFFSYYTINGFYGDSDFNLTAARWAIDFIRDHQDIKNPPP